MNLLWALFQIAIAPFKREKPRPGVLVCQSCGADMGQRPIYNTSKGLRIHCGRCGAVHEYNEENG